MNKLAIVMLVLFSLTAMMTTQHALMPADQEGLNFALIIELEDSEEKKPFTTQYRHEVLYLFPEKLRHTLPRSTKHRRHITYWPQAPPANFA